MSKQSPEQAAFDADVSGGLGDSLSYAEPTHDRGAVADQVARVISDKDWLDSVLDGPHTD